MEMIPKGRKKVFVNDTNENSAILKSFGIMLYLIIR